MGHEQTKAYYVFIMFFSVLLMFGEPCEASGYRAYNRTRYCLSNLKTIEGAVELYLMENTSAVDSVEVLVKNGYLKTEPHCSGSSQKYIFEKSVDNSNFKEFYKLVKCSVHGFYLQNQNIFDQEKIFAQIYARERRFFFGTLTVLIGLLTIMELAVLMRTQPRRGPSAAAGDAVGGDEAVESENAETRQ